GHVRSLAGDVLATKRNGHADIAYHVLRHGLLTKELAGFLLGEETITDTRPWLDTNLLGRQLIRGIELGIHGATAAFEILTRSPNEHELLARAALAQLKSSPLSGEARLVALQIAVFTNNAEAALDLLKQVPVFEAQYIPLVNHLTVMANARWRTRNPK